MELNQSLARYRIQGYYRDFWAEHLNGMKLTEIDEDYVHRVIMKHPSVSLKERVPANSTANNHVDLVRKILRFGRVTLRGSTRTPYRSRARSGCGRKSGRLSQQCCSTS
jgi:hypothetical protein